MLEQNFPKIFVDSLHDTTMNGTGRIFTRSQVSEKFEIKSGTGQGDPPSAPRYNIEADPGMRAVQKATDKTGYILENGLRLPLLGYADDQIAGLNSKRGVKLEKF